jgi:hypothetical protein
MADPNQQAADKLNRETKAAQAAQQASFDKATEAVRTGKMQPPTENDMGPLAVKKTTVVVAPKKFSKGGSASSRADGIAQRGKTRGTIAAMCGGGKTYKK